MSGLERTTRLLTEGVEQGLHTGAQLYVDMRGEVVADWAAGQAREGVHMGPDTLVRWFSSGKPVAALAVARLWEAGRVELDAPVARYVPEFAQQGKEGISLRHVLTHTGGFRNRVDLDQGEGAWEEILDRVCAARKERNWAPGRKAGYHVASGWYMLGEVVRRIDGRPFCQYAREEIFQPLGMEDCWLGGMGEARYRQYGQRLAWIYATGEKESGPLPGWNDARAAHRCHPGAGGYGPMRELARLYLMLRQGGELGGRRLLSPQTVEAFTARQRTGLFDQTFGHVMDWGLGFVLDSKLYGVETAPYGYGRYSGPRTYGHSGQQSSAAFCDPDNGLVVAVAVNGMPGPERHHRRFLDLLSALYQDLDLATGE